MEDFAGQVLEDGAMKGQSVIACLLLAAIVNVADGDAGVLVPSVVVRDGQFVACETGERFRPVGFNYIRLFNDPRTADHDFAIYKILASSLGPTE